MSDRTNLHGVGASEAPLRLDRPPSLRRLGPTELFIENAAGLGAALSRHSYHLWHGSSYWLRVRPQPADDGAGPPPEVTAEGDEALRLSPMLGKAAGAAPKHVCSFSPRLRGAYPLPTRTKLTVTLAPADPCPLRLTLPVVVWPPFGRQFAWACGVFLTIVTGRFFLLLQAPEAAPLACLYRVLTDFAYLSGAAVVALLLLLCLKAVCLAWLLWGGLSE